MEILTFSKIWKFSLLTILIFFFVNNFTGGICSSCLLYSSLILMCPIPVVLCIVRVVQASLVNFRNIFTSPEETVYFSLSSPPSPRQPGTHSLCLWISLFWTFPSVEPHPVCPVCLLLSLSIVFSGSVHIVVSVRASLLFGAE